MKRLILLFPLLTGCARQVVDPATIAPFGSSAPNDSYIDRIRREGEVDRTMSRIKWYHGR